MSVIGKKGVVSKAECRGTMGERKGEQEAYKGRFERMQKIVGRQRVQVTLSEDPQTLLFGDLCPATL